MSARTAAAAMAVLALSGAAAGCNSQATQVNTAIGQAKQIAAQTHIPQQVVWTDTAGNTTTAIVQPPAPGSTDQTVIRNVAGSTDGPRLLAPVTGKPSAPVILPYSGPVPPRSTSSH